MPNRENYVRLSGYISFSDNYVNENVKYKNLYCAREGLQICIGLQKSKA